MLNIVTATRTKTSKLSIPGNRKATFIVVYEFFCIAEVEQRVTSSTGLHKAPLSTIAKVSEMLKAKEDNELKAFEPMSYPFCPNFNIEDLHLSKPKDAEKNCNSLFLQHRESQRRINCFCIVIGKFNFEIY